jgi:hypothetical protein
MSVIEYMLGPTANDWQKGLIGRDPANVLKPREWKPFGGGQIDQLTTCPPTQDWCGMNQVDVLLRPYSAYEFRYSVRSDPGRTPLAFGDALVSDDTQDYHSVDSLIPDRFTPSTRLHLTGGRPENTVVKFFMKGTAATQIKDISLVNVGPFPLGWNPYKVLRRVGNMFVLENSAALPRAFFVSIVQPVNSYLEAESDLWQTVTRFNAEDRALVQDSSRSGPLEVDRGTVERLEYRPNHVDLDVTCGGTCFMVLSDLYLPGWIATVNGKPTRIYQTNGVVRGVFVPQGKQHIDFAYRPKSIIWGLAITLTTLAVVVVIAVRSR